jgi:copper chaperone NosL
MSNLAPKTALPFLAAIAAGALFVISLKLPVWHLKMEAPQYQDNEALRVRVYPGSMQGDLREITVLNKYIGVRIPEQLPELRWLPVALVSAAVLGVGALVLRGAARCRGCYAVAALLSLTLLVSAAMAQWQMHRIGHQRDPHAALKGVQNFTPPILGSVKVANFTITTGLGTGAFLIGAGILLEIGAGMLVRRAGPLRGRGIQAEHTQACALPEVAI